MRPTRSMSGYAVHSACIEVQMVVASSSTVAPLPPPEREVHS